MRINVVDAPCGYGKTSWAIEYMSEMSIESHSFIYITPFLSEIDRVKGAVRNREFYSPANKKGETKMDDLHKLLGEGKDICATHSLFQMANAETKELLRINNYTLLLDEVMNVIDQVPLKKDDIDLLMNASVIDIKQNDNGIEFVEWNNEKKHYDTEYNKIKKLALTGNLLYVNRSALMWRFPIEVFKSFHDVFIMTYFFKGQLQKAYYDLYDVKYNYFSVRLTQDGYKLVPYVRRERQDKEHLSSLVNIYQGPLNKVGDKPFSLSKSWLEKQNNKDKISTLRRNVYNYLMNQCKANLSTTMWTTVIGGERETIKKKVSPKSYKKAFVSMTERATNQYREKKHLAYLVNRYMNPIHKKFFEQYGVSIDEKTWALSELIQWVWRSQIRDRKRIELYIPSKRMRQLLEDYLTSDSYEDAPVEAEVDNYPTDWHLEYLGEDSA
ncbi:hypothetical protein LCM20_14720 [Halobacillus litoralis]|uniref:hypothetical protein n=1 Tax=Halobacillus litoralis TaxID=45668 RepID=UPI001CD7D9F2|nr:hypothetical protein [Halobacillus litoralis]MCA0971857.1 hypothetical protein [Halobacillus litoralis]